MNTTGKTPMSGALKRLAIFGVIVVSIALAQWRFNIIPMKVSQESEVPTQFELPTEAPVTASTRLAAELSLPTTNPAPSKGPQIRMNIIPWNATMALNYANGGPMTTAGSLMEKHGIRLLINRQNDVNVSQAEQVKFAQAVAKGDPNPSDGIHFTIIMGDYGAAYLSGINKALRRLGNDYRAEVVGAVGYSRGEDAFMGPEEWKTDPSTMRGGVVAGVLRDGDWNIAQYYLQQNRIKNNPDETTWDPDALNWVAVDDFTKATSLFVQGHCESRPIVKNSLRTGETKKDVCVQGVVTWTPEDVKVAKLKGGVVKILSTKENAFQMPATIIGIHKWNADNPKKVEELLAAAFEAADQVRAFEPALQRAARATYAIMKEESAAYWLKYYRGETISDKKGLPIPAGGSSVANLSDNLVLFGIADGTGGLSASIYRATYEGFGTIAKQQYPRLVDTFPPIDEAVNPQFLQALATKFHASATNAEIPAYDSGRIEHENIVAKRDDTTITFETGKATFTPEAESALTALFQGVSVGVLSVEIEGHTDNVGMPAANIDLSERRANAVRDWLRTKAPVLFPANRISTKGFGDTKPVASNATPDGRARNRRVTIVLGTKG